MPDQLGLPFRSASDLAFAVRRRQIGARELLDLYWSRVERFNPDLNAIVVHDIEAARRRADEADAALARGDRVGPLLRRAHDGEGIVRSDGNADDMGHSGQRQSHRQRQCGDRAAADRCRRQHLRQDERAALSRGLADLQRGLRHDEQSVGSRARPRRLVRRCRIGARLGHDRARARQRHRRLDPQPGALLRRLRPQADLRSGVLQGPRAAGDGLGAGYRGRRAACPQRPRSGSRPFDPGGSRADRPARPDQRPRAAAPHQTEGFPGGGHGQRSGGGGRPADPGRDHQACRVPLIMRRPCERHGTARFRHRPRP